MKTDRILNLYNRLAWPHASDPTDINKSSHAHTEEGRRLAQVILSEALPGIRWFKLELDKERDVFTLVEDAMGVFAWHDDVKRLVPLRTHLTSYKEWMDKVYARQGGYATSVTSDTLPGDALEAAR